MKISIDLKHALFTAMQINPTILLQLCDSESFIQEIVQLAFSNAILYSEIIAMLDQYDQNLASEFNNLLKR